MDEYQSYNRAHPTLFFFASSRKSQVCKVNASEKDGDEHCSTGRLTKSDMMHTYELNLSRQGFTDKVSLNSNMRKVREGESIRRLYFQKKRVRGEMVSFRLYKSKSQNPTM